MANLNQSLFCKSINASLDNDENVVKPPQIPTVKKILHSGESIFPRSERPKNKPINKLPNILTRNVLHGKTETYET